MVFTMARRVTVIAAMITLSLFSPGAQASSKLTQCFYEVANCSDSFGDQDVCKASAALTKAVLPLTPYADADVGSCDGGCFEITGIDRPCDDLNDDDDDGGVDNLGKCVVKSNATVYSPGSAQKFTCEEETPVGLIVGIVAGVCCFCGMAAFFYWRHQKKNRPQQQQPQFNNPVADLSVNAVATPGHPMAPATNAPGMPPQQQGYPPQQQGYPPQQQGYPPQQQGYPPQQQGYPPQQQGHPPQQQGYPPQQQGYPPQQQGYPPQQQGYPPQQQGHPPQQQGYPPQQQGYPPQQQGYPPQQGV